MSFRAMCITAKSKRILNGFYHPGIKNLVLRLVKYLDPKISFGLSFISLWIGAKFMAVFLYPLFFFILLWMFFVLWRTRRKTETRTTGGLVLQVVVFSFIYDTLILSTSHWLGEGLLLQRLNWGKYLLFALFVPLLMVAGLDFARRVEITWAQNRYFQIIIWLGAIILMAVGVGIEWLLRGDWVAETSLGVLWYVHPNAVFPFATVLTALVLCLLGVLIWRKSKWLWVLIGGGVMFLGNAVPIGMFGPLISSGTQVVLLGCLVATERHLLAPDYSLSDSELDSRFGRLVDSNKRSKKK